MSHLFDKIFNKQESSSRNDLPLITITERENLSEKLPWIVKKTITIYEDEKGSSRRFNSEVKTDGKGSILLEQYRMKYLREKGKNHPVPNDSGEETSSVSSSITAVPLDMEESFPYEEIDHLEPDPDPPIQKSSSPGRRCRMRNSST